MVTVNAAPEWKDAKTPDGLKKQKVKK